MSKEHILEVFGSSYALDILETIISESGYCFETVEVIDDGKWKATIKI